MQTVLEQGSIDKSLTFDIGLIQLSFIPVCSLNTCNISVKLCRGFAALQCFSLLWLHSLSGVIRSLLCKPRAFSPAITRTWNTWSRTESACVESTTRHYNRGARGCTYTPADHRRMRLRGNVYRSSITDVKRRYTKHCNVNKMADSSGLGPGKFITLLTL